MLVLSRQKDQTIMIGDDVDVTIVDIRGDKVRLGINAPRTVQVHRKEVYEAIRRENREAAQLSPADLAGAGKSGATLTKPSPSPVAIVTRQEAEPFMKAAIAQAMIGLNEGGLPIGAVLVRDGAIVAAGHNRRVQDGNPMAHAEIDCLIRAGRQSTYRDTVLYSTLMPCYLCSGAVVQFRIPRVVVGESANFAGASEFMRQHGVSLTDLHDDRCIAMMRQFIREKPTLWDEDIGVVDGK
jgi:cytosine/creatinine deaminase